MPLVGVIERDTVARVLRSVRHAKGDVLILFERERSSGHVLFQEGQLVMARLDELRGDEAVAALERWDSGHYSLVKRSAKQEAASGRVLLHGLSLTTRRLMERWLKREGWATSIVGYPQHLAQVVSYLRPEVLLTHCPRQDLGIGCSELSRQLSAELHVPPMLVIVESGSRGCPAPEPSCVRIPAQVEALQHVLQSPTPGTRLAVKAAKREQTARVQRPTSAESEWAGQETRLPAPVSAGLTARDLWPMLITLLTGSAVIWSAWWLLAP